MNPPPDSSPPPPPSELIEAAAAAWLSLRDRGMSAAETAQFMQWLQHDPRHAAVFAELDRVWSDCDRLAAVPAPAATPDADLLAPRPARTRRRPLAWAFSLAAAAAIALLLSVLFREPPHTAETAVGAFQKYDLPDGSVAQLNTDSAIDTAFTGTERRVRVVRGEVFFTVAKDPARPFVVTAGSVAVRAVGTAFNVRQRDTTVEVLVTEGRVRVDDVQRQRSLLPLSSAPTPGEAPLLVAGERAIVPPPSRSSAINAAFATVEKVSASASQRSLAWQERRLEFESVPLAEVVREFNRYNVRQLVIEDPALAARRFSGTFRADSYESLVQLLEADFGVRAARHEARIVLRVRP